ncbi:hypothetical protein HYALB_00003133 [Hymenoscyphus albidus]|uniref:Endothelin-converting enzyme 1 n=1 Tax=Hymenoscyphus albidus TaxID=595503 RepID=A0A9N9LEG5_9HELO|nr:hypothetical protein HYALB_00003133 [Hymenoscyphus albidus]
MSIGTVYRYGDISIRHATDWQSCVPGRELLLGMMHDASSNVPLLEDEVDQEHLQAGRESRLLTWAREHRSSNCSWRWLQLGALFTTIMVSGLLAGVLTLLTPVTLPSVLHPSQHTVTTCSTPECRHIAEELQRTLSPNYEHIDPCNDFRNFTCAGWDLHHDLRENQVDLQVGTLMAEDVDEILRRLLETPEISYEASSDRQNYEKLTHAYSACMDEDTLRSVGAEPLRQLLGQVKKLFTVQEETIASNAQSGRARVALETKQLSKVLTFLAEIEVSAFVSLSVQANERDPGSMTIYIDLPKHPGLPTRQYYTDLDTVEKYTEAISHVFQGLKLINNDGSSLDWSTAGNSSKNLVDLEIQLAAAYPSGMERSNISEYYNSLTLQAADALMPQISIQDLVLALSPECVPEYVIVKFPRYLEALSLILGRTDKKVIQSYNQYVEDDAVTPLKRFNRWLEGQDPDRYKARWRDYVKHVDDNLGWLTSRFYVQKTYSAEDVDFATSIWSRISDAFISTLRQMEWMSKEVRRLAIDKVLNITYRISHPLSSPNLDDPESVQIYYSRVEISNRDFFANVLSMTRDRVRQMWLKAGKATNRDEWSRSATSSTAYYRHTSNEIILPAGMLQPPAFWGVHAPRYITYGAFGSIAGHELSHAFDSTGRHFDQTGNYTNWWDSPTIAAFQQRTRCFVTQYANYSITSPTGAQLHVDGQLTLNENIADAGGLGAAFAAWKLHEEMEPDDLLPGLEGFSKEQLFFIAYGGMWCAKTRPANLADRIYSDPHAPSFARLLGTMQNSGDFRRAFHCEREEPTCALW